MKSYKFVRPPSYWDAKAKAALRSAENEIVRLRTISERQSLMLATALKEKNELVVKASNEDVHYYVGQIQRLQLDLSAAHTQLNAVKTLAAQFFEALGVK